jgi:transcriptional regulator with XRE-family HTH domain
MKLNDYIKKNRLTWEQFADMCGVSRQTIYHALTNKSITLKTIRKIETASNGKVTAKDFTYEENQ